LQYFFLTHPGNRGRNDLRCPLGCRDHYNKIEASKRASVYYQSDEGKKAKKIYNQRRYKNKEIQLEQPIEINTDIDEIKDKDFMVHLDFMMSLTEGQSVGLFRIQQIHKIFSQNWRLPGLDFWEKWCKLSEP